MPKTGEVIESHEVALGEYEDALKIYEEKERGVKNLALLKSEFEFEKKINEDLLKEIKSAYQSEKEEIESFFRSPNFDPDREYKPEPYIPEIPNLKELHKLYEAQNSNYTAPDKAQKIQQYRDMNETVKTLIADYNKEASEKDHQSMGKRTLGREFIQVTDLNDYFSRLANKEVEDIKKLEKDQQKPYSAMIANYDKADKSTDMIKKAINSRNDFVKNVLNREIRERNKEEAKLCSPEAYAAYLNEVGKKFEEKRGAEIRDLEWATKKAAGIYFVSKIAKETMESIADKLKTVSVDIETAPLDGELKTLKDNIAEREKKEKAAQKSILSRSEQVKKLKEMLENAANGDKKDAEQTLQINKEIAEHESQIKETMKGLREKRKELDGVREQLRVAERDFTAKKDQRIKELMGTDGEEKTVPRADVELHDARQKILDEAYKTVGVSEQVRDSKQVSVNLSIAAQYYDEAYILKENKDAAAKVAAIKAFGEKADTIFKEDNLGKADKIIKLTESIYNFINKDSSDGQKEDVDIRGMIEKGNKAVEGMLQEKEETKEEHLALQAGRLVRNCGQLLKNMSANLEDTISSAKEDLDNQSVNLENMCQVKELVTKAAKEGIAPNALSTRVQHMVACSEEAVAGREREIAFSDTKKEITEQKIVTAQEELATAKQAMEAAKEAEHQKRADRVLIVKDEGVKPTNVDAAMIADGRTTPLQVLSAVTGQQLTEKSKPEELMSAMKKLYINGLSAVQYLNLEAIKDDPEALTKKAVELGTNMRNEFRDALKPGSATGNVSPSMVLAVENQDGLLSPVRLENTAVKDYDPSMKAPKEPEMPHMRLLHWNENTIKKREYDRKMEQYNLDKNKFERNTMLYGSSEAAFQYNQRGETLTDDMNAIRIKAAQEVVAARGGAGKTAADDTKKVSYDEVVKMSRGDTALKSTATKQPAVSKPAPAKKTPEKSEPTR